MRVFLSGLLLLLLLSPALAQSGRSFPRSNGEPPAKNNAPQRGPARPSRLTRASQMKGRNTRVSKCVIV